MFNRVKKVFVIIISLLMLSCLFTAVGCEKVGEVTVINYVVNANYVVNSINHRGYYTAPENTLSAYVESAARGFNMVECDISFTKDGVAVLLHDKTVDRTSNGTGAIKNMTFEEARALDFGSWKDEKYKGEKIPSFAEFIALCRDLSLHPYIEVRWGITDEQAKLLIDTVKRNGMIDKVTWISGSKGSLKAILNEYSDARIGLITMSITEKEINDILELSSNKDKRFIDCNYSKVDSAGIKLCMDNLIPLEVWTVDNVQTILNLDPYISGVTSDNLIAGKVLSENAYLQA